MPYNTKDILKDANRNPIPQKYNPATDAYEPLMEREFFGNSTETKPTSVQKGSTFYEFDTGNAYIFTGSTWVVL